MSLKPQPLGPIPAETYELGQELLAEDDVMRRIGEQYAEIVRDEDFAQMYSHTGQPAMSPARLALVSVLQAMEHISDRQAIAMVRTRIDWKYALHLPLNYAGFDASVLSEFRDRLIDNKGQRTIFDGLLEKMKTAGMLKGRRLQRTDSLLIVAAVRDLNRLELVMETLRLALIEIAKADAQWLKNNTPASWLETYGEWTQVERLVKERGDKGKAEQTSLMMQTARDGFELLEKLEELNAAELMKLPAVETLQLVWSQQFEKRAEVITVHTTHSREGEGIKGKDLISTPHDKEARYTQKRDQKITGYKLQLTETATEDGPAIITDIEVVESCAYDGGALEGIHQRLDERDLLPEDGHLVDRGYVSGETIDESKERGVELIGPVQDNTSAAARAQEGFSVEHFKLDFDLEQAICPQGKPAQSWTNSIRTDRGQAIIQIVWNKEICSQCPFRGKCVQGKKTGRVIKLSKHYPSIARRRQEQKTDQFHEVYRRRSGVEATLSYIVLNCGARSTPHCGKDKTCLHYLMIAAAVNLRRAIAWQAGRRPKRQRVSTLQKAMGVVNPQNNLLFCLLKLFCCPDITFFKAMVMV